MQKFLPSSVLAAFFIFLAGCSSSPPMKAEPVEVAGTVVFSDGKPVANVVLNIFPTTASQTQGSFTLKADGKFEMKLIPGNYTFAFEGANLNAIPKSYQSNDAEHKLEVPSAGNKSMTITVTK
jgi:uncharacterized protein YcfL